MFNFMLNLKFTFNTSTLVMNLKLRPHISY